MALKKSMPDERSPAVLGWVFFCVSAVAGPSPCANTASGSLPALTESALAQAQKLTGLERGQLRVLDAAAVNWPDGSGGCPEPGRLYTQAIVPGFRIRIQAGARLLNYHATQRSTAPVLCSQDRVQPALPAGSGAQTDTR